jgi:hypothetical protein
MLAVIQAAIGKAWLFLEEPMVDLSATTVPPRRPSSSGVVDGAAASP